MFGAEGLLPISWRPNLRRDGPATESEGLFLHLDRIKGDVELEQADLSPRKPGRSALSS